MSRIRRDETCAFETREARYQAARERIRLDAVRHLRTRKDGRAEVAQLARAIGAAPNAVGKVVAASPMTFRASNLLKCNGVAVIEVELHPHLVQA